MSEEEEERGDLAQRLLNINIRAGTVQALLLFCLQNTTIRFIFFFTLIYDKYLYLYVSTILLRCLFLSIKVFN